MREQKFIPELRFPEFTEKWQEKTIDDIFDRVVNAVEVEKEQKYQEIGIRSHGKGIFHKEYVYGKELGNKRVFWLQKDLFIVNIVFAWEMAVAKTTENEEGLIASHRFPMYQPKSKKLDLDFILFFFLRKKGKHILELASPGGAGRNKTLGQKEFAKSKVIIPKDITEQQKIGSFLLATEKKIKQLEEKKDLLQQYKKGIMQKIFNQEIRFKDDNGDDYPNWEEKKISDIFEVTRGQVLSMKKISNLTTKESKYPVYSSQTKNNGLAGFHHEYLFEDAITWTTDGANAGNVNYRKGKFYCTNVCGVLLSKDGYNNQMVAEKLNSITHRFVSYVGNPKLMNNVMKEIKINIPKSIIEQSKISDFLSRIDIKIEALNAQLENTKAFKKGLLQKMFV